MQIFIPAELFQASARPSSQTSDSAGIFRAFAAESRAFFCLSYGIFRSDFLNSSFPGQNQPPKERF